MSDHQENRPRTSAWTKFKWVFYAAILMFVAWNFFNKNNSNTSTSQTVAIESVVEEPTEGVITKVSEVQAEVFKITDEEVVPNKEDSKIIATYMDGREETYTLEEVALVDTTITEKSHRNYSRSLIRSVVIGGAIGYMMGRPMGSPIRRTSYASQASYNKSNTTNRTRMRSSANRKVVRTPRSTKSGYGSGKSTRSYGG